MFLLKEDHSAGFGSYSGIEARPFTVGARGIRFASRREAIRPSRSRWRAR
ncbi:Uncharacterised protein [Chromobacterium violaceum]|uniref:Uncharacterized protein n=1 Tax=Chromobacterium violaceum TaxID=536 RepID=A0A447TL90_CHRVL|nr:Uncharacterised protein [Chromobacterium violaceum]